MAVKVFPFGEGRSDADPKQRDVLGGKGAGLVEMTKLGLPVPPGVILPTDLCLAYLEKESMPEGIRAALEKALSEIGRIVGMTFGDPKNPLLVSVRSGARASMPGMMDTILNLGLNDATAEGLAKVTGNARFVWDAYRRFITMYANVAMGLDREPFEHAIDEARARLAKSRGLDPSHFTAEELKRKIPDSELAEDELKKLTAHYKELVKKGSGKPFPEDPMAQLMGAVEAVFRSWNNPRAIVYRKLHDIPHGWGTACIVQAMVFGNLGDTSATGVAFTRNPSTGEAAIYGEWLPNAQGEDVVAGIRTPLPLRGSADSLEQKMPEAYAELMRIASKLEDHFRDMQDLEFTVQRAKLWMLQCRNGKRTGRAAVRIAVELVREKRITQNEAVLRVDPAALDQLLHPALDPKAPKTLLAKGLPASPGAASGKLVFTANDAEKQGETGVPVILARVETSPEDIHGMKAARGIITARGGMTSHAAVVARGMGKCCVVSAAGMQIDYHKKQFTASGKVVREGDVIAIDGSTGEVFQGEVRTVPAPPASDHLQKILGWADEVRKLKVRVNGDTPEDARRARAFGAEGIGLCRTEHMFFEPSRILAVREMIFADDVAQRRKALDQLLPMQRGDFVAILREMHGLPVTIRLLDPPLHEFLPQGKAEIEELARALGRTVADIEQKNRELHEQNPMLGHRGCRLAVTYPEIYEMQARAIAEATVELKKQNVDARPEIMIPIVGHEKELDLMRALVVHTVDDVFAKAGLSVQYTVGTMIELPRACVVADRIAERADFFSFGTNDLTQTALGLSRDDAGRFLPAYLNAGIYPVDPFAELDQEGVGALMRIAVEKGRGKKPGLKIGICGEHGGDPKSIAFCAQIGLDYVSCSPFRVYTARVAAAQAQLAKQPK